MNILVACEFSGVVRDAFRARGHNAWSCDVLPSESREGGYHLQGDVLWWLTKDKIKEWEWGLMIAHPPCTYLCNSGVHHLHKDVKRWFSLYEGALFFKKLLSVDIPRICIENPIQHKYAKEIINCSYTQIVHPWMFGHAEQKSTCLWLKNLPELKQTKNVKSEMEKLSKSERNRLHYLSPSKDRGKRRSITYQGIANAMAAQWG